MTTTRLLRIDVCSPLSHKRDTRENEHELRRKWHAPRRNAMRTRVFLRLL
jgi:hypothetical protein